LSFSYTEVTTQTSRCTHTYKPENTKDILLFTGNMLLVRFHTNFSQYQTSVMFYIVIDILLWCARFSDIVEYFDEDITAN